MTATCLIKALFSFSFDACCRAWNCSQPVVKVKV